MQEACRWASYEKNRLVEEKARNSAANRGASNFLWRLDSEISRSREKRRESQIPGRSVLSFYPARTCSRLCSPSMNKRIGGRAEFWTSKTPPKTELFQSAKKAPRAEGA